MSQLRGRSSSSEKMTPCPEPGCEFAAGHERDHPHGRHLAAAGTPCEFCGKPEPCEDCWQPITVAMFKGLCAEAGKDTAWE